MRCYYLFSDVTFGFDPTGMQGGTPTCAYAIETEQMNSLWAYGVRPTDRIVRLSSQPGTAQPLVRAIDRRGLWAYVKTKRTRQLTYNTELTEHRRLFSKWKPDVLMAQTTYCHSLAKFSEMTGDTLSFRIVVTAGGILDDSTRKLISDRFGAEVYDHYGIEEVGGGIAGECPSHSGYHMDARLQNSRRIKRDYLAIFNAT